MSIVVNHPVVWVVQQRSNMNFLPALQYGEIHYLWPETYQIQYSGQVQAEVNVWRDFLARLKEDDYLLLAGDPMAIAVATIYAYEKLGDGKLRFLKWDRQERLYVALQPTLNTHQLVKPVLA